MNKKGIDTKKNSFSLHAINVIKSRRESMVKDAQISNNNNNNRKMSQYDFLNDVTFFFFFFK